MKDRRLQVFLTAADAGSFAKAAEKLLLTPASVMNQINALEAEVGARLFERTSRGVSLTEAGESFAGDARRIAEELEEAAARAREAADGGPPCVRVGTSLLNPAGVLVDLVGRSRGAARGVQIQIVPFEDDGASILSTIASLGRGIDIIVGSCGSRLWESMCGVRILGEYNVCCAVPADHRLAGAKSLRPADLRGERLMMGKRGDAGVLDSLRDMLEKDYPEIEIVDTPYFYDADIFNKSERAGCVLLTLDAWAGVHPSLVTLPVEWDYRVPYGLIFSKTPARAVRIFLESLGL
ncbi:LysR family transcriptional regulator [Cloacibacillus sp. An23]|uniref:LysR family transcriptional regulator n=1 Tax=Cloacibacillus sp. An23 TaxID=1965591 RepID=UPI000B389717|nr:LysR family transcriptional regulator [Cloacibacillus sp. An23]OUO92692.1 hypothetical protein B5F39_11125 [Cloacibacillus sp. An23]